MKEKSLINSLNSFAFQILILELSLTNTKKETNCQVLKETETGLLGIASAITKKDEIQMYQWPGPASASSSVTIWQEGVFNQDYSPRPNENGYHQQEQPV